MSRTLISLDEYKAVRSIASAEYDAQLLAIINKASSYIKTYCGRTFIDNYDTSTSAYLPIVEYTNYNGSFITREFPIVELTLIEYSTDNGTTFTAYDGILDRSKDVIVIGPSDTNIIEGINAFKVTYTGGYANTPEDLKLACIDLVDYYYKNESVPRKTSNNNVIEYVMTSDLPAHIKRVLDLYRVLL